MKYEIILSPEAIHDLKLLDAYERTKIKDLIEIHLRHEPTKTSKSRIKRLRGLIGKNIGTLSLSKNSLNVTLNLFQGLDNTLILLDAEINSA